MCGCVCVCVHAHASCTSAFCPSPAQTLNHIAWLKQKHLNECQEAALSYMQLSVAIIAKGNCRQNNVHTEERSWVIIHSGLEARNKCPCVIDYTLQANEINRAWIDSVGEESCQRGICSRVQWLYWHAHIQRSSEKRPSCAFGWEQSCVLFRCMEPLRPPSQSGSVLLKSNASDGIWQVAHLQLNNHR